MCVSLQCVYSGDEESLTPCDIDDDAGPARLHMLAVVYMFTFVYLCISLFHITVGVWPVYMFFTSL